MLVLLVAYLLLAKPRYETSWVMLLPGTERASTINLDNIGEARSSGNNAYGSVSISPKNTYREIALSDAVISTAAERYGVQADAFSKPRITLVDQTPAMQFTLKGESQDDLRHRAELYNEIFHNTLDQLRSNEIERNIKGVENNLSEAKDRLSKARKDIVNYQTSSSIVSDKQFERWISDAEQLRTDKTTTFVKIAQLKATITASLGQLGISQEQAQALLTLQANPVVASTLSTLSTKLAEQANIKLLYASAHPARKKVDREAASLTKSIRLLLTGVPQLKKIPDGQLYGLLASSNTETIKSVNAKLAEYEGLTAQKFALRNSYKSSLTRLKTHTIDAATLADLKRAHQIAEAIFSSALAKLDTSRLDIYATYPLTQLLTQPGATVKRSRLQEKLMIVAAILIYGLLAMTLLLSGVRRSFLENDALEISIDSETDSQIT
ncbi:MAG: hypothetical protein ACJAQ6_000960 [Arenicella sp.]|jgi:uncharacterized protein involved in exopolysaccharide biosynthesis